MNRPTWKELKIENRVAHSYFGMVRDLVIESNVLPIEAWFEIVIDLLYKHGYTVIRNKDHKQPTQGD